MLLLCALIAFPFHPLMTLPSSKSPLLSTDVDTIVSALYHHSPWTSAAPDAADLHEHHWLAVTFLVCAVGSCASRYLALLSEKRLMSVVKCSIRYYRPATMRRADIKSWALQPYSAVKLSTIRPSRPSKRSVSCLHMRDTLARIITRILASGHLWGESSDPSFGLTNVRPKYGREDGTSSESDALSL
jgi:hypothetical protein